jgi:predicted O-methyltransferase YrrM
MVQEYPDKEKRMITKNFLRIKEMKATSGVNSMEGEYLIYLISIIRAKTIVEIGSCQGRSTCYMADAIREMASEAKIHCVDLWDLGKGWTPEKHSSPSSFDQFMKNLKTFDLEKYIEIHKGFSAEIGKKWDKPIDFLFIDGGHKYEEVLDDFRVWSKHVRQGGIIAFHDVNQAGVGRVIEEELTPSVEWTYMLDRYEGRISAFRRMREDDDELAPIKGVL